MSINTQTNQTLALFATIAVLWGISFTTIETGLDALPLMLFVALRYGAADAVLFDYGLLATKDRRPRGRDEWLVAFAGDVPLIGAHLSLLFSGQRHVTSGVLAIVISLVSVLTPLLAWPMLPEEHLDAFGFLGVLLGPVGTVVVALVSESTGGQFSGVPLLSLATVVWALSSVLVKRLSGNPSVVPMQSWMMLIGAAALHVMSPVPGELDLASVARMPAVVAALLLLVVLCNVVGFIAHFILLDRIGVAEIGLANYITPVVVAVTGWTFLGERLNLVTVTGLALIPADFASMKRGALGPLGRRFGVRIGLIVPAPVADPDGLPTDN